MSATSLHSTRPTVLEMRGVSKQYPGVRALTNADLGVPVQYDELCNMLPS